MASKIMQQYSIVQLETYPSPLLRDNSTVESRLMMN